MDKSDKKNKSIQLLLSEAELSEIEDWRHENRIGSRNEAIRQLIKQGIEKK
ncbi:MAG: hypothetical protein R3D71_06060 [Rickettsiales bacterium]